MSDDPQGVFEEAKVAAVRLVMASKTGGATDPADIHAVAYFILMLEERGWAAALSGARGGKKGGRARADALSPERRSEIARNAAEARWAKERARWNEDAKSNPGGAL